MTEDRLLLLMARQFTGDLTPQELQELRRWAEESEINREFLKKMSNAELIENEIVAWKKIDPAMGYAQWAVQVRKKRRNRIVRIAGWGIAASLITALVLGGLTKKKEPGNAIPAANVVVDNSVPPGKNTAILTLANGQRIRLDSVGKGDLTSEGNTRVVKADSGSLAYLAVDRGGAATVTYNILTTPRSGQYQLILSDGSKVWLNNVSSLRYPTSFPGKERMVELTGEAYFEIAGEASRPFVVKVKDEVVEVLGTSFNIMAYADEGGTQTTLLEGAVAVKTRNELVRLKPDQQAQIKADGGLHVVNDVAGRDIISWKDGFFYFGRASFAAVMRQLARWYDIDVVYDGKAPEMEFGGKIDRSLSLNDLLKFLDKNQIHFRLEGRKLIVLPN